VESPDASSAVAAPVRLAGEPRPHVGQRASAFELEEELEELEGTIASSYADALLLVPDRQRLLVLAWIARARAIEDESAGRGAVSARVARIAARLSMLTKLGWPGNVRALALRACAADCSEDLPPQSRPGTWSDVAVLAEEEFARREAEGAARGLDEWGWADAAALDPRPPHGRAKLDAVLERLARWTGPVVLASEVQAGRASVSEPEFSDRDELREELERESTALARTLRWLRGEELEGWGEAMGRVRWIAERAGEPVRSRLRESADPAYVPRGSWASVLGHDPEARERKRRKNELLRSSGALHAADATGLRNWLAEALGLGPELTTEKIAAALRECRDAVLAVEDSSFPSRGQRKRLRMVKALLGGEPAPIEETEEREDAALDADRTGGELDHDGALANGAAAPVVAGEVLRFTRGKRVLFVCNRTDPRHDGELLRTFGFGEVQRCEPGPRRIESAAERIRSRSYDLVLAATGFMPHKAESALRRACARSGVTYVRVNKGRISACAQHLARELGLGPGDRAASPRSRR
jgi:hypothetical protein